MISILAFMLIALGFLIAAFIGFLAVPAYRRRTERLATERLKRSMPLTEAEIRADKDRLRAEYALAIHELEAKLDKATQASARQRVEINRRDATITGLKGEVERLRSAVEEHENARRVLEQTIVDRLPKVEQRLVEARRMLDHRDREVAELSELTQRQARALEEASHVNTQARDEVHRLTAAMKVRSSRGSRIGVRGREAEEHEEALKIELETLKSKTREQAERIAQLEGQLTAAERAPGGVARATQDKPEEVQRLRRDLADAEASLRAAQSSIEAARRGRSELEAELAKLKGMAEEQSAEIGRLKAGLEAYKSKEAPPAGESKALQARLASLQAQTADQEQRIKSLKSEIAAANERTALQAAQHTEEMRRLGGGARGGPAAAGAGPGSDAQRGSLADRIGRLSVPSDGEQGGASGEDARAGGLAAAEAKAQDLTRAAAGFLKSVKNGNGETATGEANGAGSGAGPEGEAPGEAHESDDDAGKDASSGQRRSGLLERITRLDRAD